MNFGSGKLQAVCCGIILLAGANTHAASGDRSRIIAPVFVRPVRENLLPDRSGIAAPLMEKSRRERPVFEMFSSTKPVRLQVAPRRDPVEEVYHRSPGGGFEIFPRAHPKPFRRIPANGTGDSAYRTGHVQHHGRDVDN